MTKQEVATLIAGLERSTWPLERWHHDEHLAMAVWYLVYLPRRQALEVIGRRLRLYNAARGIPRTGEGGYHETLTLFLSRGIGAFLDALPEGLGLEECLRHVLDAFRDFKPMLRAYYTPGALQSFTARVRWVEPDRLPMRAWLRQCEGLARAHRVPPSVMEEAPFRPRGAPARC